MEEWDHLEDEEIVTAYRESGDAEAFRALIERYHDPLFGFLFRMLGDREAAEDTFQDAFLQVHQSLDTFDPERRFKPWLFTIAANKARDLLRKRQRRGTVSLSTPAGSGERSTFLDLMEVDLPHPSSTMEQEEVSAQVQRAIEQMPPNLRDILLLAYFQKLSYAQIADQYDIPLGTVKSRLHSAVANFAKRFQEQTEQASENAQSERKAPGDR